MYDEAYFAERDRLPSLIALTAEKLLHECHVRRVLEVGMGTGRLMKFLRESGYSVEGMDRSPISARIARGVVGSATHIPFVGSSFDSLIAVSLIEHLSFEEGTRFVGEIYRVLRPGGVMFIVTPNFSSPLRYFQGNRWFGYMDKTHLAFYTPRRMRHLLGLHGFRSIRFTFRIDSVELEWPLPGFFYRLPPRLKRLVNHLLVATPLALCRDSFWVAACKPA
jgi:SAM-dependent methyltransferase